MKKNLWVLLLVVMACNKSQDNIVPANDQKVLGMVLQAPASSSTALILLKDGRTINPVSGFTPSSVKSGSKFVLSFQPLASSGSSILNVRVTSYSSAADSTFTPPPPAAVGIDSASLKSILSGTFNGTYSYSTVSGLVPGDTSTTIRRISVAFTGSSYAATFPEDNSLGGSGTFIPHNSPYVSVQFVDPKTYPSASEVLILNGTYYVMQLDVNSVALWKYNDQVFSSYLLKK